MAIPELDLKKVNLQAAVGYLISLHDNEVDWNLLGIRVIGAIEALPIPEGNYEYGDAYMVGTEPPYDMYIYTRPDGKVHTEGYWFPVGKFPMPGPKGPKGDGLEQITREESNTAKSVAYDSTSGATIDYAGKSLIYTDSTTGEIKTQTHPAQLSLPIVPGKYISMNATHDNKKMEIKVDDTALALDYIKINKELTIDSTFAIENGKPVWYPATQYAQANSFAWRNSDGDCSFRIVKMTGFATQGSNQIIDYWNIWRDIYDEALSITKTTTDTGTLTTDDLSQIQAPGYKMVKYDNQLYYRYDPRNAPDGTLNFIHLDSIEDGNGGYKATGKCFSITVSTRAWEVFDLDFGGSTRTTHNLAINDSSGNTIYFSLTNNRTETYEGAPAGLWSALEDRPIACSVNNSGVYSAGMITTDGDNFKVFYGNSEELTMTQTETAIADNMV